MPVQHSPPSNNTISQRNQPFLTPTARATLDCKKSVHQMSENLVRGTPMEGTELSRRSRSFSGLLGGYPSIYKGPRSRLGQVEAEEGEESVETEVSSSLEGSPEASEGTNISHYNQPIVSQAEPNFLKMMEQVTQLMGQLTQEVSPRDS
ncbi:hypothetical protein O181_006882 [Austropuccinia psidii MF-1]|uniref:Uncharacterized protein n=1 Tax=Austropuccinia psidii MF-1 TaxID=1389203 RepID=A0A9Q3BKV0_9BASI|nr:hypothetical protein [Austropuccinia psidii MF-1]